MTYSLSVKYAWKFYELLASVKSTLIISSSSTIFPIGLNDPSVIPKATQHSVGWVDYRLTVAKKGI